MTNNEIEIVLKGLRVLEDNMSTLGKMSVTFDYPTIRIFIEAGEQLLDFRKVAEKKAMMEMVGKGDDFAAGYADGFKCVIENLKRQSVALNKLAASIRGSAYNGVEIYEDAIDGVVIKDSQGKVLGKGENLITAIFAIER